MNAIILLSVWSLPLLLAPFAGHRYARWMLLLAPLPALFASVAVPVGSHVPLPWLLLGVELGLDDTGRVFLMFSGLLWLTAGLYAAGSLANARHAARFRLFFLLAMAGNLGLIVAADMVSFYLGFTLMGLAAYGLIAHPASLRARHAARRYLAWTIAGELLLFTAIVMLAQQHSGTLSFDILASNPPGGLVVLLLITGFGIKLALPGLHLWLPQAYAVAPAPAVAVLSGAMIKAGLLGWLRFLPSGDAALAGWGQALIAVGITGIFFGALAGLLQRRARFVLGYSSIGKMGVLTAGMGATLAWPEVAPALTGALVIFAAHHALVKGALFLGIGLVERGGARPWTLAGLGFLAFALAGAPLTSGALAKSLLTAELPDEAGYLLAVLSASAFFTTLLMSRLLFLVWTGYGRVGARQHGASTTAWLVLLTAIAVFPFALADAVPLTAGAAPVASAALLAALTLLATRRVPGVVAVYNRRLAARPVFNRLTRRLRRRLCLTRIRGAAFQSAARDTCGRLRQIAARSLRQPRQSGRHRHSREGAGIFLPALGVLLLIAMVVKA